MDPPGAVSWVPLDETQGTSVVDAIRTDQPGTLHGPAKWVDGHSGKAFDCDGTNWIDLGNAGDFDGSHGFSWGCWIRPQGALSGAPIARMTSSEGHRGYDIHLSNGTVAVHLINTWPSDAIKVNSKNKLKEGEWAHVFVTWDASKKASGVRLYVNGDPWEWTAEEDRLTGTLKSNGPFYIGRRNTGSEFKGLIDDVRLYDRVLLPEEVATLAGSSSISPLLARQANERTEEDWKRLRDHYLTARDEPFRQLTEQREKLTKQISELRKPVVNVMVMKDLDSMRETFVLERGNYASPLKDRSVRPDVPSALPALPVVPVLSLIYF